MNYVFILGTEECAPNCLATAGAVPAWSGKTRSELTRGDLDDMLAFCMKEGQQIGYDDYRFGRPLRINPFHRRFLHGMPHLYFKSFYEIGRKKAKEAQDQIAEQLPLLAA